MNLIKKLVLWTQKQNKKHLPYAQWHEYCKRCEADLTMQEGYNNELPYWICKGCGEMLINPDIVAENDIAWILDKIKRLGGLAPKRFFYYFFIYILSNYN